MSVCVLRNTKDGKGFDLGFHIPIATQKLYDKLWQPAIDQLNTCHILQDNELTKEHLPAALSELIQLKEWANVNLSGEDLEYMVTRIELLEQELPGGFLDDNDVLWIG